MQEFKPRQICLEVKQKLWSGSKMAECHRFCFSDVRKSSIQWIEEAVMIVWWFPNWNSIKRYWNSSRSCSHLAEDLWRQSFHRCRPPCCCGCPVLLLPLKLWRQVSLWSSQKFEFWSALFLDGDSCCLSSWMWRNWSPLEQRKKKNGKKERNSFYPERGRRRKGIRRWMYAIEG